MVKNLPATAGDVRDLGLIPGSGRSPGEENGNHSGILAWRIPWTEEPAGLQTIRIRHNWSDLTLTHPHVNYIYSIFILKKYKISEKREILLNQK